MREEGKFAKRRRLRERKIGTYFYPTEAMREAIEDIADMYETGLLQAVVLLVGEALYARGVEYKVKEQKGG